MSNTRSKSGLFLMELIIAIAFFAVASAICVQLFATAHTLSSRSSNTNMAITMAQNAAESFKHTGADPSETARLLDGKLAGDTLILAYNQDWSPAASPDGARFTMEVDFDFSQAVAKANITVTDHLAESGEILYQITANKYAA